MKHRFTIGLMIVFILALGCLGISSSVSAEKNIKLNHAKYSLQVGKSVKLKITSGKKETQKVKWKSSNQKVASVTQKGVVKGKKVGKATITANVNKKKVTCKITVQDPEGQPAATATAAPTATPLPTPPNAPRIEGKGWRIGKVIAISDTCPFEGYTGYIHISYNGSDTIASHLIINDDVVYTKNNEVCTLSNLQPGDWINFNFTVETGVSPVNTVYGVTQVRILGQ